LKRYSPRRSGVNRRRCDGRRYPLEVYRTKGQVGCHPSERRLKNTQVQQLRRDVGVLHAATAADAPIAIGLDQPETRAAVCQVRRPRAACQRITSVARLDDLFEYVSIVRG